MGTKIHQHLGRHNILHKSPHQPLPRIIRAGASASRFYRPSRGSESSQRRCGYTQLSGSKHLPLVLFAAGPCRRDSEWLWEEWNWELIPGTMRPAWLHRVEGEVVGGRVACQQH